MNRVRTADTADALSVGGAGQRQLEVLHISGDRKINAPGVGIRGQEDLGVTAQELPFVLLPGGSGHLPVRGDHLETLIEKSAFDEAEHGDVETVYHHG